MTTVILKKELHKTIDGITDRAILEAVYTLLKKSSVSLKPMTPTAFLKRNTLSQKEIKEGKTIAHADVKKRFK